MSGTARMRRGRKSISCLATVAGVLVMASLISCSRGALARSGSSADSVLDATQPFHSELSSDWENLVAHNKRITPTPNWDGSIDGMKTLWFEGGAKRGEGRFVKGSKEDAWTFWYENGQKRWEGTYHKDLVNGVERSWYPSGALCYEGTSVEGRRHGTFRAWYEDRQPWWKGDYQLGVRQGPFHYWHRDGSPDEKVSGIYVDGKRVAGLSDNGLALAQPK